MEVTKRYPLVNMYHGPGHTHCYSSLTRYSPGWFERLNRQRGNKKPEIPSQFSFLERAYSSVIPIRKVLGTPEESVASNCARKMPCYSSWKSNTEHLKLPVPFPALPDSSMNSEIKSYISVVREIFQKLLSIRQPQHFCDLVSGIVNAVFASHNMAMTLKKTLNLTQVSESDSLNKSYTVENGNLLSDFCESVSTFEVGYCGTTNQSDNKKSVPVVNHTILDVTKMSEVACLQEDNTLKSENLVPLLCEDIMEVQHCSTQCQASDKGSVASMSDVCHNSSAREMRPRVKNKLKNVDEEMVTRKQRRINKHSKKRKRRIRKKEKMSSADALEKGNASTKNEVLPSTSSQTKCRSAGSRTVFHDWEDSDEDFCIVFDDDSACDIMPKNMSAQSTLIEESGDLWVEFESMTIISGKGSASVDCRSYSSEISIQCDSDSDVEYDTDSGQIFVDTDDFDSFSGLVFLSDNGGGCSVLPGLPYVHCSSFMSGTASYELVNDCVGIREVNRKWREITSGVDGKPRLPQRVTFAPEEELVSVFPVDMIDRKSEWEQFALERFRFKRRIDEFEKIIAPYLTCAHREKTFRRLSDAAS